MLDITSQKISVTDSDGSREWLSEIASAGTIEIRRNSGFRREGFHLWERIATRRCTVRMNRFLTAVVVIATGLAGNVMAADTDEVIDLIENELGGYFDENDDGDIISVDLLNCGTTDENVATIVEACPNLQKLILWGAEISDESVKLAGQCAGLKELTLENTGIRNPSGAMIAAMPTLEKLTLRRATFMDDNGLAELTKAPKLRYLTLLYCNFSDEGLKAVATMKDLRLLDIRGNIRITDAGVASLQPLTAMKALRLRNPLLTDAAFDALAEMKGLRVLSVEDSASVTDAGVAKICKFGLIEELDLFRCAGLTDECMKSIATLKNLKRLKLRGSPIKGPGLAEIAGFEKLEYLELSETSMGDDAIQVVATLPKLKRLDLWLTQVGDGAIEAIAKVPTLEWLSLKGTKVTDAGLRSLTACQKLTYLDLSETGISDAGLSGLESLPLATLNVKFTPAATGGENLDAIKAAHPKMKLQK